MEQFTRRSCLLTLGTSAIFIMSGCGGWFGDSGGGSPSGSLQLRSYSGTVILPAGVDTTNLHVVGPFSTTKIEAGTFKATGIKDFPSPVSIVDVLSGKTVLLGMLDPNSPTQTLGAANCAASLLFFAIGGSQLSGEERQTGWTAVLADPATAVLASAFEDRLANNLYALEDGDQTLIEALEEAARNGVPLNRGPRSGSNPAAKNLGRGTNDARIIILHPSVGTVVNGVQLIDHNNQGVSVVNHTRREALARYFMTVKTDPHNSRTILEPPRPVTSLIRVPRKGQTEMVPIAIEGEDMMDDFDVIYLTPVFDSPEPEFFTKPAYAGEVATWRADLQRLFQRAQIGLVSKILLEAVGVSGIELNSDALDRTIANMQAISPEASTLVLGAREGTGLSSGVKGLIQLAAGSDQGAFDFLAAIAPLLEKVHPVLARDLAQRNLKSEDLARVRGALRLVSIMGAMALSLELGPEYKSLTEGERANQFNFRSARFFVRLNPSGGNYTPGQTIPFTATAEFAEEGATYKWSLSGISHASLDDQHGKTGFEFETSQKSVLLKTAGNSIGNAVVFVEVFNGQGSERWSIGSAQTTLTNVGGVNLFIEEFDYQGATYVNLMANVPKPHAPGGGNHYVGGTVRANIIFQDLANQIFETRHMEFVVPPFTGLPGSSVIPPQFAGTRIFPVGGSGGSSWAGVDCYDLGDRLVLIKMIGQYFPSSTPAQVQATRVAVMQHQTNTTLSATFP